MSELIIDTVLTSIAVNVIAFIFRKQIDTFLRLILKRWI